MTERKLNVLRVWSGGDSEGRAVRDVSARQLTAEQETALMAIFGGELFDLFVGMGQPDAAREEVHFEIRGCAPLRAALREGAE